MVIDTSAIVAIESPMRNGTLIARRASRSSTA
jgi:uncharacterized protein with PIN domain